MNTRLLLALPAIAALAVAGGCRPAAPPVSPELSAVRRDALPAEPGDPAWRDVPVHRAPLILQDMVEPRLIEPSTAEVRVQAATDGARIVFRLEWADPTPDDLPGEGRFCDACAIQLPARGGASLPAPQMGEPGGGVEIAYWRASWQSAVDGRGDSIRDLHPGASVDHYPFEAASLASGSEEQEGMARRYSPARALGNPMEGPRTRAVEDLIAEGPGTLTRAPAAVSEGKGRRTDDGWVVVISRPLPAGLAPGGRGQAAFAVWQGAASEAGSRKMRSVWIPLGVGQNP